MGGVLYACKQYEEAAQALTSYLEVRVVAIFLCKGGVLYALIRFDPTN